MSCTHEKVVYTVCGCVHHQCRCIEGGKNVRTIPGPCSTHSSSATSACVHAECRGLAACQRPDDGSLTFARAMALDPGEVEFCYEPGPTGANWSPLAEGMDQSLHGMRHAKFRRSRPRRIRVEEMAAEHYDKARAGELLTDFAQRAMTEAILAVCEYLRTHPVRTPLDLTATDIERHFLGPR